MKKVKDITQADVNKARETMHPNANGKIIGVVRGGKGLTRKEHSHLQRTKQIQFVHTYSGSGDIIVRRNDVVLGCCNISQAGRGYVFANLNELKKALK